MPFNFQIRDGLIEMTYQGKFTGADVQQLLLKVEDAELRLAVTPDRITNMSDADTSGLPSSILVSVAEARQRAKLKNKIKSAIIATRPEHYGLARLFMRHNQNPDISIEIFKDSASAYNWLGRKAKSDDKTNV